MPVLKKKTIDKSTYELAIERINRTYDLFDEVWVSFSAGKDSTAVLNLAIEVARERDRLPVKVIFFDEEAIPYHNVEYVERVRQLDEVDFKWCCLPLRFRNVCSRKQPWWWPWNKDKEDLWVRDMPDNDDVVTRQDVEGFIQEDNHNHSSTTGLIMPHDKKVGIMLGIRAQESLIRYRAVARREEDNYFIKMRENTASDNHYKVYPIYDWTTNDVWTAPKKLGWDYNEYYDVLDKMGISPHSQRVSNPFGAEPVKQLTIHNELFPEDWNKMVGRVPGVATARRWATTELYSYKKLPKKPDDMEWEEFISHFIKKYDKKTQKKLAKMIKQYIKLHYKKTNQPILPDAEHPKSGVSWKLLLRKVVKGDLKDRNQAQAGTHDREKYEKALKEWKDENTASK